MDKFIPFAFIVTILLLHGIQAQLRTCSDMMEMYGEKKFGFEPGDPGDEKTCLFQLLGVPDCRAGVTCEMDFTKVDDECSEAGAYLIISDGSGGEQRYCGNTSFALKPSHPAWPSLFVTLHVPQGYNGANLKGLSCKASCNHNHTQALEPLPTNIELKQDLRCVCGLQNKDDRIVGGEDASMFEFPWLAVIVHPGTRRPMCGASVINDRYLLTAAHCDHSFYNNDPPYIEVLFHVHTLDVDPNRRPGAEKLINNSLATTDEAEKTQRFQVSKTIRNHLFTQWDKDFDVALVKLATPINFGDADAPTPICLPPPNDMETFSENLVGKILTIAGWGLTNINASGTHPILQKLDVPCISREECQVPMYDIPITGQMLCTGGYEDGKGGCPGDSGGPLIYKQENNQFVQVGVVSFGSSTCEGQPTVYAKVSQLMQWIHFHTSDAKWCKATK